MVVVDTNVTPGRDFDTLRFRVEGENTREFVFHYAWDDAKQLAAILDGGFLPFTLSVQNAHDSLRARRIALTAWKDGVPRFAREATLVIPTRDQRELRFLIDELCFDSRRVVLADGVASFEPWAVAWPEHGTAVSCAEGETCVAGECVSDHVSAESLPVFAPERTFGGRKGPTPDGECVDVRACLAERSPVGVPLTAAVTPRLGALGCSVDVHAGLSTPETVLVAVDAPSGHGSCDSEGCITWLMASTNAQVESGFTVLGSRILLPPTVCREGRRAYVRTEINGACAGKSRASPACAEWSSVGLLPAAGGVKPRTGTSGGREDGGICSTRRPDSTLCKQLAISCGHGLAADAACSDSSVRERETFCGDCNGATSDMVRIKGGIFQMGTAHVSPLAGSVEAREIPVHDTTVRPFWLDLTEVTTEDYERCVAEGGCTPADPKSVVTDYQRFCNSGDPRRGRDPINCVDWFQANSYCGWLGKRLPTEEEWEFAARGGPLQRAYPWGNDPPSDGRLCWRRGDTLTDPGLGTCAVRSYPNGRSIDGVYDLSGNVYEWTVSGYSESYDRNRTTEFRVGRGGSYVFSRETVLRAAARHWFTPESRRGDLGFRCAL
jgi:formylglycine-generating enzyme required for sulfatase activity